MTISIKSITPTSSTRGEQPSYQFVVLLAEDGFEAKISMGAETLINHHQFVTLVLERTGRLYGDGTFQSWPGELRKHLNAHWLTVKLDKCEVPKPSPPPPENDQFRALRQPVEVKEQPKQKKEQFRAFVSAGQQGEALEPFPLPPNGTPFWEDPGVGQAVS